MGRDEILGGPHFNPLYDEDYDGQVDAGNVEGTYSDSDAQDAVGGIVQSPLVYNGGTPEIILEYVGNLELDADGQIRVNPAAMAGQYLSEQSNTELSVNVGNGLEGDGADNIRVSGGEIAAGVLAEGPNPYQVALILNDDDELPFGAGNDVSVRYGASEDAFVWQDNNNGADRMELDRTTGDLDIEGALSEGSAL